MADNTTLPGSGDTVRDIDRGAAKTQVVTLDFGGEVGPEQLVTLTNPLPISRAATNFIFSALGANSSVTQLARGGTFVGSIESLIGQTSISVLLTMNQPAILTINQFIDAAGVYLAAQWQFQIEPNVPFSDNFLANGNYCQVVLTNIGTGPTTTLNLNVAYGTSDSISQNGNLDCSLSEVAGVQLPPGGSIPVAITSTLPILTVADQNRSMRDRTALAQLKATQAAAVNGFIPLEIPEFLMGG